ncbi:hypothetical protein MHYP_G00168050 [Metynnis hypsauchen]
MWGRCFCNWFFKVEKKIRGRSRSEAMNGVLVQIFSCQIKQRRRSAALHRASTELLEEQELLKKSATYYSGSSSAPDVPYPD